VVSHQQWFFNMCRSPAPGYGRAVKQIVCEMPRMTKNEDVIMDIGSSEFATQFQQPCQNQKLWISFYNFSFSL